MKTIFASAVMLMAGMAVPAHASEWWFVDFGGKKPNRTVFFIEREGVRKVGIKIQAWESQFHETAEAGGALTEKQLREYDCDARTSGLVSYIEYSADGQVLKSSTISPYTREQYPAAPDTIADAKLKFVCGDTSAAIKIDNFDSIRSGRVVLNVFDNPEASK